MKKLFSSKNHETSPYENFIGKQYQVADLILVVEKVIAEGGFSYVFLARDTAKNRHYALKRILVNSEADLDNCKQEIAIMKQFHRHPSMVGFRGYHTKHIGNGIYEVLLLMVHCPNGTVVDKMNHHLRDGFDETTILDIFVGICDAVAHLHAHDYTHRDLKVENILIGPQNQYVLCDFGSAMKGILDPEKVGHTIVEEDINRLTTPAYRAPEMVDIYSGNTIGPPSDCWALGVLLYKLCFFTTPFEDNTLAIARAKYTIPNTRRYSDRLISVIRDTLKQDPKDRITAPQIVTRLKDSSASTTPSASVAVEEPKVAMKTASPAAVPTSGPPATAKHLPAKPRQESDEALTIRSRSRPKAHAATPPGALIVQLPPAAPGTSPSSGQSYMKPPPTSTHNPPPTSAHNPPPVAHQQRHSVHNLPEDPWGPSKSPTTFDAVVGKWDSEPFEDEFLKLSLRDKVNSSNSNTAEASPGCHDNVVPARVSPIVPPSPSPTPDKPRSVKVTRAQIPSRGRDPWSSNEPSLQTLSLQPAVDLRVSSKLNTEDSQENDGSLRDTRESRDRGASIASQTSSDSLTKPLARKKKKRGVFFSKRKSDMLDSRVEGGGEGGKRVERQDLDSTEGYAIVSNPLHPGFGLRSGTTPP